MTLESINYIWGAVGCGFGICFASACLTIGFLIDTHDNDKRCIKCRKTFKEQIETLKRES